MITFTKGQENVVGLEISAVEPLDGFSASLAVGGIVKTTAALSGAKGFFTFSAAESDLITTDLKGEFGTLLIFDPDGEIRLTAQPSFRLGDTVMMLRDRTICVSLPYKVSTASSGSSGDLSNYVTKKDLSTATAATKKYTDDKLADIGETIIAEQQIGVVDSEGHEQQMTVQEAMQNVLNVQNAVEQIMDGNVTIEVKDEDHDLQPDEETLHIITGKKS